jgi:hypothetical protein
VGSDDPVVALAVLVDVLTLAMVLLSTKVVVVLLTLVLVERTSLTAVVVAIATFVAMVVSFHSTLVLSDTDIVEVDVFFCVLPTVDVVLMVAGVIVGDSFNSHAASSIVPSAVAKP